ncbi:MAG: two-component sensor histidine kinase [Rhodocyclales bacterium]|nr:two-component sensor histidine kinase [Rhodocyclales bacterium]
MSRTSSLRLRLVLLTTAAVAVVWLLTAVFTWRSALHEIEELLNHPPATASHMQKERAELAGEIARHLLMPTLIALPGLALVLVVAVGFSLRPLRRLGDDIAARAPDRLTPIDSTDTPREIVPLIERLNDLFAGIGRALENERRFTADASHELRTPLAALKAQAQVALAATDSAERLHALNQILVGCDRATHLLTQLLTLARLDAGTGQAMTELALRPLAEAALADAAGDAIARGCELVLADGDARVRGDAALLQSMLRNLVDNALRHGSATQIEIGIVRQGKEAILSIRDDGKGIPATEFNAVRQRFRRGAGADSHGSGLGLSIVGRIAELHGGRMEMAPAPAGRGLVLHLRLPALADDTA